MRPNETFSFSYFVPRDYVDTGKVYPAFQQALEFNTSANIEPLCLAVNEHDEPYLLCQIVCPKKRKMIPTVLTVEIAYGAEADGPKDGYYATAVLHGSQTAQAIENAPDCPFGLIEAICEYGFEFDDLLLPAEWIERYENAPMAFPYSEFYTHKRGQYTTN